MIKLFKTKDSANLCVRPVADYDICVSKGYSLFLVNRFYNL